MLRRTGMANSWREVHVVASDHGKRRLLLHCLMSPTGHGGDIIKRLYIYIYMHRIELNVLRANKYKRSTTNEIY